MPYFTTEMKKMVILGRESWLKKFKKWGNKEASTCEGNNLHLTDFESVKNLSHRGGLVAMVQSIEHLLMGKHMFLHPKTYID